MFKYFKFSVGFVMLICLICSVIVGAMDIWNKNYTACGFMTAMFFGATVLMFGTYCLFYTLDCIIKFIKK